MPSFAETIPEVFKAYDVRGLYPSQLNEALVRSIGYHYGVWLDARAAGSDAKLCAHIKHCVVVGRDVRPSSPMLAEALIDGLLSAGFDVFDIGLATTPMVYFACGSRDVAGGIMVTASHNPAGYNGLKFCAEEARPVSSTTGLADIARAVVADLPWAEGERGERHNVDILDDYASFVATFAPPAGPKLTIAVDTANGTVGPFVERLLAPLGAEVIGLFLEPDGSFPNHEANPLKLENLVDVREAVVGHNCDFGLAFDGDGDRVAFVDDRGEPVAGDVLTALVAKYLLRTEAATVLYDLRSSRCVREEVNSAGGKAIETRVGHSFIKASMREHNAVFAGELSGHYYFRECFFAESPELTVMAVASALRAAGEPLSTMVEAIDRYPRTGEVNFKVGDADEAIARVAAAFADGEQRFTDGITITYPRWWCNIRKSNTEPLLRLNLEADDEPALVAARRRVEQVIASDGPSEDV